MALISLPQRYLSHPQHHVEVAPEYADAELLSLFNTGTWQDLIGKYTWGSIQPTSTVVTPHGLSQSYGNPLGDHLKTTASVPSFGKFTVFARVRPNVLTTGYTRILETEYSTGFFLGTSGSGNQYNFIVRGAALDACIGGQQVVGESDLIVGVFDGTDRILYSRGREVGRASALTPFGVYPLYVGVDQGNRFAANWKGSIDTIGIFSRVFSPEQILSLYNNPSQLIKQPRNRTWFTLTAGSTNHLTGSDLIEEGTLSTGGIGVAGTFIVQPLVESGALSTATITRSQDLVVPNLVETGNLSTGPINPYARLKSILASTPLNTWVQVNTTQYIDCQMPVEDRPFNAPAYHDHVKIVIPWSSFSFDHDNGHLLLWGGGHGNYLGNQLYYWKADTGAWELACLPSAVGSDSATRYIVDGKAPQSAHTYQNNLWLKHNRMFGTFGGAAAPGGGPFMEAYDNAEGKRRVAPWVYDLDKKDSTKVGGSTGSGMNPAREGLNAWQHRRDNVPTGGANADVYPIDFKGHAGQAAVYTSVGGKDVVFFTVDSGGGFPSWYRYEFGNIREGQNDTITWLGNTSSSIIFDGWGVFDSKRGCMYRNAWAKHASYPTIRNEVVAKYVLTAGVADIKIELVDELGNPWDMNPEYESTGTTECPYGAVYDSVNDRLWLWGGRAPDTGVVYYVDIPAYDHGGAGWATTTWVVKSITPAGSRPNGLYQTPILGKIKYVPEIEAFIILDRANTDGSLDPGVWLFKTSATASESSWPSAAAMFALF